MVPETVSFLLANTALRNQPQHQSGERNAHPAGAWNQHSNSHKQEAAKTIPIPLAFNQIFGENLSAAHIGNEKPSHCV